MTARPATRRGANGAVDHTLESQPPGRRVVLGTPLLDGTRTRRLAELGLRQGGEVVVLHRTAGRGAVVAVGETRIALDRSTLAALPITPPSDSRGSTTGDNAERHA